MNDEKSVSSLPVLCWLIALCSPEVEQDGADAPKAPGIAFT